MVRQLALAILAIAAALSASPAEARDPQLIDTQRVNSREDRVVFRLERAQGVLAEFRLRAGNDAMLLTSVEIVFDNSQRQIVNAVDRLPPGGESRRFVIESKGRLVSQIVVWKRPNLRPGQTTLQLIGVLRDAGPPAGQLSVIDVQTVDARADRIQFRVGRREGRFTAIRFRTAGDPLLTTGLDIEFANRERQTLGFVERIVPPAVSRPVDLSGEARRIETVTLYKRPSLRPGRVTVELLGIEVPDRREPPPWAGIGPQIPRGWVLFGVQTVDFRGDRDVVPVGAEVGRFERVALRVLDNDIFLREITVVYANGERDRKVIETEIRANSQTRAIDLKGDRFIRQIELVYQSRPDRRGPAIVEIYGDFARDWIGGGYRDHNRGWALLGSQRASMFSKDSDVIPVGERFGRLKALRFTARREDIRIYGVKVFYGNGESEDVPVSAQLKEGQVTPQFDLKGWGRGRFVDRIAIKYRSKLTLKGQGMIEAWGLQ